MVKVVTFLDWNNAAWRDEFDTAVTDYLRRSGEEMTLVEEWSLLNAAMLGQGDVLLLIALDDTEQHVHGFCVLRALPGTQVTGNTVNIWQAYAWPGRARIADMFVEAYEQMAQFALHYQAKRFTLYTRRMTKGYEKVLASIGFKPYMLTYSKGVLGDDLSGGPDHGLRPARAGQDVQPEDSRSAGVGDGSDKPVRAARVGRVVERGSARRHRRSRKV